MNEAPPPDQKKMPERSGLLGKARSGFGALGRLYTKAQFGDMQQFVEERRNFRGWLRSRIAPRTTKRHESFDEAVVRLGIGEDDVSERYKVLSRLAWTYGLVAGVALLMLVASPFVRHSASQFFISLGLLGVMGARCLISRFRMAEIRARRLMSFQEWIGLSEKRSQEGGDVVS